MHTTTFSISTNSIQGKFFNLINVFKAKFILFALFVISTLSLKSEITVDASSYIIDKGVNTAVKPAGLRPYEMIHELVKFYGVPVIWVVRDDKAKYAVDYTIEGNAYKGGLFIIPGNFITTSIDTAISGWIAWTSVIGTSDETKNNPNLVDLEQPSISMIKTAAAGTYDGAGDLITYMLQVKNTGNVTITNINITDVKLGLTGANKLIPINTTLLPGQFTFGTTVYDITQAEVDSGAVINTAIAEGTSPTDVVKDNSDNDTQGSDADSTIITLIREPSLAVIKKITRIIDLDSNGKDSEGDKIIYRLTIKNTGNVTLVNIGINDTLANQIGLPVKPSVLLPGDSATSIVSYLIKYDDLLDGKVINTALAYAESVGGPAFDVSDSSNYVGNKPTIYILKPVIAQPSDIIIIDTAFCSGGIATLRARSRTILNPVFRWYSDAGLNNLLYVGDTYPTGVLNTNSQYYLTVTGTLVLANVPNNGKVAMVTIYPVSPKPTVTAAGTTNLYPGGSVVLSSSVATTYQWYKDGVAIIGATSRTYTANVLGVYSVATTNSKGCPGPASDEIIIGNAPVPPTPVVSANKLSFCVGDNATLRSSATNGNQWYKNGVAITGAMASSLNVTTSGNYTVIVTNSSGCISSESNNITIVVNALPAAPVITIIGSTKFCKGETRIIKAAVDSGSSVQWYRNGNLLAGISADSLKISDGANYTARVVNASGSVSSLSNTIATEIGCITNIRVPDLFTPNGDGINDKIKPILLGISKFRCFKVFNRWGNLVFETIDANIGWDGTFRGKNQPSETYLWLVEGVDSNGKEVKVTGMFTLMR